MFLSPHGVRPLSGAKQTSRFSPTSTDVLSKVAGSYPTGQSVWTGRPTRALVRHSGGRGCEGRARGSHLRGDQRGVPAPERGRGRVGEWSRVFGHSNPTSGASQSRFRAASEAPRVRSRDPDADVICLRGISSGEVRGRDAGLLRR